MTVVTEVMALAAVAGVAVLVVRFLQSYLHFRKLELAIPGTRSLPLLGNALEFHNCTPDTVLKTLLKLVGGYRTMCRASIFNYLIVAINSPEEIEEVTRRKDLNDKSVFFYSLLHDAVGKKGLIQLNGAEWKAHRKWLVPGFNQNVLNRFVSVFSDEAKGFVDRVVADKEVDVLENLRKTVMRDFLRTSMTVDDSQFDDDLMHTVEFIEVLLRSIISRSFNPFLWSDLIFSWTPVGTNLKKLKSCVDSLCARLIARKREELKNTNTCDFEQARKTLMDILLEPSEDAAPGHVTEDAIMDEFRTFLGANVETTVSGLCWMLKVLSLQPEAQEQVHAELDSVFGDSERDVTYEDLSELKYLDRFIKEVMRMYPPIPWIARQCYEETELCGHTLPAGTTIALNIYGVHRDPKHWDEPSRFNPDRFLPENCKDRHPCAYIPFSTGNRNCIGGKYALMNTTTFLATTLRAYRILPVDDHKDLQSLTDNMTMDFASRLVGGVRVKFRPRNAVGA